MPRNSRHGTLRGRRFVDQDLHGRDFSEADLSSARFQRCNLSDARFHSATLLSTRFEQCNLTGADLTGAKMGRSRIRALLLGSATFSYGFAAAYFWILIGSRFIQSALSPVSLHPAYTVPGAVVVAVVQVLLCEQGMRAFSSYFVYLSLSVAIFAVGANPADQVGASEFWGSLLTAFELVTSGIVGFFFVVAVIVGGASSVAGALVGIVIVAVSMLLAGGISGVDTPSYTLAFSAWLMCGLFGICQVLIRHRVSGGAPGFNAFQAIRLRTAAYGGTSFKGTNLTDANLTSTRIPSADFAATDLTRTKWREAEIHNAWFGDNIRFRDPVIRSLLVNGSSDGNLSGRNLSGLDLSGSRLAGTDLSHADLSNSTLLSADLRNTNMAEAQALGAAFCKATLTGACLRDWNIDHRTNLAGVECDYFFLLEKENKLGSRERRPHQADAILQTGVFEKLFVEVRDTIDLMIKDGGDRAAWLQAFRRLLNEYPEIGSESIRSIKRAGGMTVITLAAPPGIDKEGASLVFHTEYQRQLETLDAPCAVTEATQTLIPVHEGCESNRRVRVFISYSHKDEALKNELKAHLSPHERAGLVEVWHDREILPGTDWESAIDERLYDADLVLCAISSDFIASHYCYVREMEIALERQERGEAEVVPIIFRSCDWTGLLPLSRLQALPTNGHAVESWPRRDEAWTDVSRGLRRTIGDWRARRGNSSS